MRNGFYGRFVSKSKPFENDAFYETRGDDDNSQMKRVRNCLHGGEERSEDEMLKQSLRVRD